MGPSNPRECLVDLDSVPVWLSEDVDGQILRILTGVRDGAAGVTGCVDTCPLQSNGDLERVGSAGDER
jgi:hypothetical protein